MPEAQDPVQVPVGTLNKMPCPAMHLLSSHPQDTPVLVARSGDQPGLPTPPITAEIWPKLAFSPSVTFIYLPASGHVHQPSHNQMVTLIQCHSTWPCNNPTETSLSPPWHVNWVNTRNSSTGRLSTSPKSQRMPSPFPWYGPFGANATLQEKS